MDFVISTLLLRLMEIGVFPLVKAAAFLSLITTGMMATNQLSGLATSLSARVAPLALPPLQYILLNIYI